jgi:hypothetical protein
VADGELSAVPLVHVLNIDQHHVLPPGIGDGPVRAGGQRRRAGSRDAGRARPRYLVISKS